MLGQLARCGFPDAVGGAVRKVGSHTLLFEPVTEAFLAERVSALVDENRENGGAKLDHGSGGEVLLRAA